MAYLDWGPADAKRVVVCVHGLTRNAHDFDALARELVAAGCRVLAVDVVGRGRSSWLEDPQGYVIPTYAAQLKAWLAALDLHAVDWIGTSMGGLIGMALAAAPTPPMARLILNDIGPFVSRDALLQIKNYVGQDVRFASLAEAEQYLRRVHASFGPLRDDEWQHLTRYGTVADGDGWRLHYDPAIQVPYAELAADDVDLWAIWDAIRCPTFVLHGAESAILSEATCEAMRARGPAATVVSLAGIGHAPALMAADQIRLVRQWLEL